MESEIKEVIETQDTIESKDEVETMEAAATKKDFIHFCCLRGQCLDILTKHIIENKDYPIEVVKLGHDFAVISEKGFVFLRYTPFWSAFTLFEHYYDTNLYMHKHQEKIDEFNDWLEVARHRVQNLYDDYREAIRKCRRIINRLS